MKKLLFAVLLFSSSSYAMSDIERGILFGANAASMGTFIAQMEGEIARIKLNYEKQTAEFKLKLEQDNQAYLKEMLNSEIDYLLKQKNTYEKLCLTLHQRNKAFDQIVSLSSALYKGLIKQEEVIAELKSLNDSFPGIEKEWVDLLANSVGNDRSKELSPEQYEPILMKAIRLYSESTSLEKELKDQIAYLMIKIASVEVHIKELP
ncbi:MAG: hypothetical protein ACKOX6_02760 [Bdellovibrio sp.]